MNSRNLTKILAKIDKKQTRPREKKSVYAKKVGYRSSRKDLLSFDSAPGCL
jgi:hypothetical protein